jgi:hypothetical protein
MLAKINRIVLLGLMLAGSSWAVTANMKHVADGPGSGIFDFNVDGQLRRLLCTQFLPNVNTSAYVANVATLDNLAGSTLALQNDPQALFKYQRVAILFLMAYFDPSLAVPAVQAARHIVDGVGPMTPAAQTLHDQVLLENAANWNLSGFKIYTAALSQELAGFDEGYLQICKVAGNGVTVGTNFTFTLPGLPASKSPVIVPAGAAPGGSCSAPIQVLARPTVINETPVPGTNMSLVTSSPNGSLLTSSTPPTPTATVAVTVGLQTTVTFRNDQFVGIPTAVVVCKVAGEGVVVGTNFSFTIGAIPVVVPAGPAPGGNCSAAIEVPPGVTVITETAPIPPNTVLTGVSASPNSILTGTDLTARTATVNLPVGTTSQVTFVNASSTPPDRGRVQVCKIAGPGVIIGTVFNFSVAGVPVQVPAGAAPSGNCAPSVEVTAGAVAVTETLPPGYTLVGVSTVPDGLLLSSNLLGGIANVTVTPGGLTIVTFVDAFVEPPPPGPDTSLFIRYFSHLNRGDSLINITNTGARGAGLSAGTTANTVGAFCANVYAFSPDEQMISCCSCPVTPNGLVSLSVKGDLISNTLTPAVPSSIVVKILATVPTAGSCAGSAANANAGNLAPGLGAWGTTLHLTPSGGLASTETQFLPATLSTGSSAPGDIGELGRITQLCSFINANGSGFGICGSCRLGGLGAGRL